MKNTKHLTGLFSILFSLAIAVVITLTFNAGTVYANYEVESNTSDSSSSLIPIKRTTKKTPADDLVSVTYKTKNGKAKTLNQKDNGFWVSGKKGDYFNYSVRNLFDSYKSVEGDKIILKYKNNITKELVARDVDLYQMTETHLQTYSYSSAVAFINPESDAYTYNYFIEDKYDHPMVGPSEPACVYSDKDIKNGDIIFMKDYDKDDMNITTAQSYKRHWVGGKTYKFTIEFLGKKTTVPVKIKRSEIKSISFKPANKIVLKKQQGGGWEDGINGHCTLWRTDSEYPEYYVYDIDSAIRKDGNKITVKYSDNTKKIYTCKNGKWKDKNGKKLPFSISDNINQTYKTRLKTGKTYKFKLFILNKSAKFSLKVVEDESIASISLTPESIVLSKKKDAYDNGYFSVDSYLYREGNKLTVNFTDGTKKVYTCHDGSFADSKGKKIYYKDIRVKTSQHEKEWVAGNTYYATVYYHGKTITLPIKITK